MQYNIFPYQCILCDDLTENIDMCCACKKDLPYNTTCCPYCAIPLVFSEICPACLSSPPKQIMTSTFIYQPYIKQLIKQFKYHGNLVYGKVLALLMTEMLKQQTFIPEVIIPVPLHPKQQRLRGFNQSAFLATIIAKNLAVPMKSNAVKRIIHTKSQAKLTKNQRQKNIQGSFSVDPALKKINKLVILDDIITTGATTLEITQQLQALNPTMEVHIWACARSV